MTPSGPPHARSTPARRPYCPYAPTTGDLVGVVIVSEIPYCCGGFSPDVVLIPKVYGAEDVLRRRR